MTPVINEKLKFQTSGISGPRYVVSVGKVIYIIYIYIYMSYIYIYIYIYIIYINI